MRLGILIPFGVVLVILGVVTIVYPQRVHDQGGARRRYEEGELTETGRLQLRGLGLVSIVLGLILFFVGVT